MIVNFDETEQDLYTTRFEQISAALDDSWTDIKAKEPDAPENAPTIGNLISYYNNIQYISQLQGGRYLCMPLNEEHFKIDLNKRIINIPTEFKVNGIAVKGDHKAEILYFEVDRYFDIIDLGNSRNIKIGIKWQIGDTYGIHPAFCPDSTLLPNKIVFGWIITKEMTQKAGKLNFSVIFVDQKADFQELEAEDYTLNTLTATVNINDTLSLDNNNLLYDDSYSSSAAFSSFLKNSIIAAKETYIGMPVIYERPDSYINESLLDNNTLKAKAYNNTLASQINFIWEKEQNNVYTDIKDMNIPGFTYELRYVPQMYQDIDQKNNHYYVQYTEDGTTKYRQASYSEWNEGADLYELVSILTLPNTSEHDISGKYNIIAKATYSDSDVTYESLPAYQKFKIPTASSIKEYTITGIENGKYFVEDPIEITINELENEDENIGVLNYSEDGSYFGEFDLITPNNFSGHIAINNDGSTGNILRFQIFISDSDSFEEGETGKIQLSHTINGNTIKSEILNTFAIYHQPTSLDSINFNISNNNGYAYNIDAQQYSFVIDSGDIEYSDKIHYTLLAGDTEVQFGEVAQLDNNLNYSFVIPFSYDNMSSNTVFSLKVTNEYHGKQTAEKLYNLTVPSSASVIP